MIISYLDKEIERFKQLNGDYPAKIVMNKETKEKLFTELILGTDIDNSWINSKDNYKGILIIIEQIDHIKLGG